MSVTIKINGVTEAMMGLKNGAAAISPEMQKAAQLSAEYVEEQMKDNAKVVSGQLRDSISYEVLGGGGGIVRAVIGPLDSKLGGSFAGAAIESGRRPGGTPPPLEALMARYNWWGLYGQAKKAAKTISQKGTVGQGFVARTYQQVQGKIATFADRVIYVAAKTIAGP